MSIPSYIRGLVSSDSYEESTVSDDELCRVSDLLDGGASPLTGFETHLLRALRQMAPPITPKEAAIVEAMKSRRWEFRPNSGHYNNTYTDPDEQAENNAILAEMFGESDDFTRSGEDGWFYEN